MKPRSLALSADFFGFGSLLLVIGTLLAACTAETSELTELRTAMETRRRSVIALSGLSSDPLLAACVVNNGVFAHASEVARVAKRTSLAPLHLPANKIVSGTSDESSIVLFYANRTETAKFFEPSVRSEKPIGCSKGAEALLTLTSQRDTMSDGIYDWWQLSSR